jgi:tetratricopeptide (TPR) repeat protein
MSNLSLSLPAARAHEMVPLGQQAVELARASGDRWVLAFVLNNLGEAYRENGDPVAATAAYEEAYDLLSAMGDQIRVSLVLLNLAEMAIQAGDLARARTLSSEALDLANVLGDQRHASGARTVLGWVALAEGSPDEAAQHLTTGLSLLRDLGAAQSSVNVLFGLAGVAAARGDVERAARLEAAATRSEEVLGHQPTAADSGIHLRYLNELRSSTDPAVWDEAAREGRAMSLDEGIAFGLEQTTRPFSS